MTILNEVGLDPGIDHMLAMSCFDEVHEKGGKVKRDSAYSSSVVGLERGWGQGLY